MASWGIAGAEQPKRQIFGDGVDAGGECCLHTEASTHFPIMSSPVFMSSTSVACSESWTLLYSKICSSKLGEFFPPVAPSILPSLHFTASLQWKEKYYSRKSVVKREVFQLQHPINRETGNFLLQIQRHGPVLEKKERYFAVLYYWKTVLSESKCTPYSEY